METSPLSHIQKTTSLQRSNSKSAVQNVQRPDTISVAEGTKEAQKIARWVEMLKQMDTPPQHFERGSSEPVIQEVSRRLAEEVGAFLTQRP